MKISDIDANLKVETNLDLEDVVWIDVHKEPFKIYGFYDSENFTRLPKDVAMTGNDSIKNLYTNTSGGRVRFSTNSPYIAIKAKLPNVCHLSHMSLQGTSGFDLYCDTENKSTFQKSFIPDGDILKSYESVAYCDDSKVNFYTIYFPLYNNLTSLYIGIKKGSILEKGVSYKDELPLVFYGSSITQGAVASRAGGGYVNMVSRYLNTDILNLGFSGGCKGEKSISEYMATIKMRLFILDYDYNAVTAEDLKATHFSVYENIRKKNPTLPILMVSRGDSPLYSDTILRREIIKNSYEKAVNLGDENVYFLNGALLFEGEFADSCTVDGTHPNDLGFYRMAITIGNEIKKILAK
ncbi:MAG: SGNH/GDSL hydrolase family protein [Clostridia bacterium]